MKIRAELAFLLFALLIGARDVGAELIFSNHNKEIRPNFAFLICATITTLSFLIVVFQRGFRDLIHKFRDRQISYRIMLLGASAAVVYLVTFEFIGRYGAGLFDLFDYGLAPILTAALGILIFNNLVTRRLYAATIAYLIGVVLLFWGNQTIGLVWVAIAILSPIGTAVSDAMTKWLLMPDRLTRAELLFVRFLPATILVGVWIVGSGGHIHVHEPIKTIPLAVFGGFLPLWLLCTGLGQAALTKYAVWEFLIPATTFLATLPWHPQHRTLQKTIGAAFIVSAVISHEIKWFSKSDEAVEVSEFPGTRD